METEKGRSLMELQKKLNLLALLACVDYVTLLFRLKHHQVLAEQVTAVIRSLTQQPQSDRFAPQTFLQVAAGANILPVFICICNKHYNRLSEEKKSPKLQ